MFGEEERLRRIRVLQGRLEGELTESEAAERLGLSGRRIRWLVAEYRRGNLDIFNDLRGGSRRPGLGQRIVRKICALKRERPERNNPQIAEMLDEELGVVVHPNTVRKSKIPIYRGR